MPNQGNRSNGNSHSGKGQTGDAIKKSSEPKPNPERSDVKHKTSENADNNTSRTSNQGRKSASGGSAED
jgi:hypothetical protein